VFTTACGKGQHQRGCDNNPNKIKRVVSKPAWNIGKSRWNNEPSYPEKFFMKVIENEFNDKNYINEYPVGIYSIDFAWVDKKLAIEIDGDQHQRFEEYKLRDERKDSFLEIQGWKVLRIVWKDMFNNTKEQIKICKNFIGPLV
jgi:very-short-patch-repair endonuclease